MTSVIKVERLSKKYIIGHQKQSYTTLRDAITKNIEYALGRLATPFSKNQTDSSHEEFWALNDISFEIQQGDRVGIIGRNGAGKSTLLKILSRITEPNSGRVSIKGRVASLLEVGTGFHPELTGRENVYLNGAILGMSKAEISRKFDEIVAFSEIEKFLDTPVKRYSSGMYVRLAFAVAAHLEPEILIVDEVLSVGDAAFQKKCSSKIEDISKDGRTVLLVSHNMASISKLSDKVIWLDQGRLVDIGETEKIVQSYHSAGATLEEGRVEFEDPGSNNEAYIRAVQLTNGINEITSAFDVMSAVKVGIEIKCKRQFKDFRVGVRLERYDGLVVFSTTSQDYDSIDPFFAEGIHNVQLLIPGQLLAEGEYQLSIGLADMGSCHHDIRENLLSFRVVGDPRKHPRHIGMLVMPFLWKSARHS